MNKKQLEQEGRKWVKDEIISENQFNAILERYQKGESDKRFLLMAFAGLFIGLGFLTFIASNWSAITDLGKMSIIIFALLGFYLSGDIIYTKRSVPLGTSLLVIGIFIFGSGIFLTGQMYHFTFYSAVPFLIWALVPLLIYAIRQQPFILVLGFAILTIGQVYSALTYEAFYWPLVLLLILGYGHYTYHKVNKLFSSLFAISFVIQFLIYSIVTFQEGYLWFIIFVLLLYVLGDVVGKNSISRPFQTITLLTMFVLTVFHVFLLEYENTVKHIPNLSLFFILLILLLVVSTGFKIYQENKEELINLVLFLPVYAVVVDSFLSLILLFVFSVGSLLIGYNQWDEEKVNVGTIGFIISTIIAYVHLAWDFMDKSLFFFIGGLFMFGLSFFLQRRRRNIMEQGGEKD